MKSSALPLTVCVMYQYTNTWSEIFRNYCLLILEGDDLPMNKYLGLELLSTETN